MRIAITGARGRLGRYVVDAAVARGHDVIAIDRNWPPLWRKPHRRDFRVDLANYDALRRAFTGCDALIHLAAIPHPLKGPDHVVHRNNVVGSYNALRAAIDVGITRLCQASSVNAIGLSFSRAPRFDYFPIDEQHPTYAEDSYALSKWICETQADSLVHRYETVRIASLRFHFVTASRAAAQAHHGNRLEPGMRELFGYVRGDASADACLLGLTADFTGHEVFNIVAPDTLREESSLDLARQYYPNVKIRTPMPGNSSFFDSSKAERILGWKHPRG